jgi:hypothetical protein
MGVWHKLVGGLAQIPESLNSEIPIFLAILSL